MSVQVEPLFTSWRDTVHSEVSSLHSALVTWVFNLMQSCRACSSTKSWKYLTISSPFAVLYFSALQPHNKSRLHTVEVWPVALLASDILVSHTSVVTSDARISWIYDQQAFLLWLQSYPLIPVPISSWLIRTIVYCELEIGRRCLYFVSKCDAADTRANANDLHRLWRPRWSCEQCQFC